MRRRLVETWRTAGVAVLLAVHRARGASAPLRGLLAFACITAGVALWSVPAALITAGVLLVLDRLTD